jgi:ubiquinone/menaquinone biosynthesis C-methylase UbiE
MAMEGSIGNADLVLEIGEKTDAGRIFSEVSGILEAVTAYEEEVRGRLSEGDLKHADDVAALILKHTNRLLLSTVPILRGEVEKLDVHDVVFALNSFRVRAADMYKRFFGLNVEDDNYRNLLNVFKKSEVNPTLRALALTALENQWLVEIAKENQLAVRRILEEGDRFYKGNEALFVTASETTGDTEAELSRFNEYLRERDIQGMVFDVGCGDGKRMTTPMAEMLKDKASIIGVDRIKPTAENRENLGFAQGDLNHLPFPEDSAELVTAHWSVLNDLILRGQELGAFDELSRILKKGGDFYFDIPYLEGGEESWEETAKAFRKKNPASRFGMIVAKFPGERAKHFNIFPEADLDAMLESSGFSIKKKDIWRTKSGKPRMTVVARLERKITPRRLH